MDPHSKYRCKEDIAPWANKNVSILWSVACIWAYFGFHVANIRIPVFVFRYLARLLNRWATRVSLCSHVANNPFKQSTEEVEKSQINAEILCCRPLNNSLTFEINTWEDNWPTKVLFPVTARLINAREDLLHGLSPCLCDQEPMDTEGLLWGPAEKTNMFSKLKLFIRWI